tara:strand:+ start:3144 stop:3386 length:243 start_codon:yes stop_codon:yes gene_type:complete
MKMNAITKVLHALSYGPCTRQELIAAGGGESVTTRIYELNMTYGNWKIIREGKYYRAVPTKNIIIDKRRVYPNQFKNVTA